MKCSILTIVALAAVSQAAGGFYGGLPSPTLQICNCNNPATKESKVSPLCEGVGGLDMFQVFPGLDPIKQHMCRMNINIKDVFTKSNCAKEFGDEFNSYCSTWT